MTLEILENTKSSTRSFFNARFAPMPAFRQFGQLLSTVHDPHKVWRFLAPLVQQLGVSVIVTDDLYSYRQVAERLGLEHQVCQFVFDNRYFDRKIASLLD